MIQHWRKRLVRRLRNSEAGQSILLLALGFIALAAFVGLVTDISIMFVRFATLRRAVDAAAIAAAGQIREGTDYGTVALSARQYITLHGLQPHRVWVETCETDIAEWREGNPAPNPLPANYRISDFMPETELCDWDQPRKLVRVTGQVDSQTTFLRLIGIPNFVITSSATSETAALDIVLVMDTSDSMAESTVESDYTRWGMADPGNPGPGQGYDVGTDPVAWGNTFQENNPLGPTIPYICQDSTPGDQDGSGSINFQWPGCCNDPAANAFVYLDEASGEWRIYTDGNVTEGGPFGVGAAPRPSVGYGNYTVPPPSWNVSGANGRYDVGEEGIRNSIPDGRYDDIICQPFKQVKDAARNFILRLDFIRGDRLGLVMFDRLAEYVAPNGDTNAAPMMTSEEDAIRTLDQYVGLIVNPKGQRSGCYANDIAVRDVNNRAQENPGFPGFLPGPKPWRDASIPTLTHNLRPQSYDTFAQCTNTNIGDGLKLGSMVIQDPRTVRRDSVWVAVILTDGAANASTISPQAARERATLPNEPIRPTIRYGDFGFCPWYTVCSYRPNTPQNLLGQYWYDRPVAAPDFPEPGFVDPNEVAAKWLDYPPPGMDVPIFWQGGLMSDVSYIECVESYDRLSAAEQAAFLASARKYCNDGQPLTRHRCLTWGNSQATFGIPEGVIYDPVANTYDFDNIPINSECSRTGRYDADDYARDWADATGLVEVAPGVPGAFIALFSIGFGRDVRNDPTAAPLMRYIADAGDNGRIDNNYEEDWRDNFIINGNITGENDPCFGVTNPTAWCGQYYYAENLAQLDAVFEAIAGRLFTRISR